MSSSITWVRDATALPHAVFVIGPATAQASSAQDAPFGQHAVVRLKGTSDALVPDVLTAYFAAASELAMKMRGRVTVLGIEVCGSYDLLRVLPAFRGIHDFDILGFRPQLTAHRGNGPLDVEAIAHLLTTSLGEARARRFHVHDEALARAITRIADGPKLVSNEQGDEAPAPEPAREPHLQAESASSLEVVVEHLPELNYAMVGAGIPLLRAITLTNHTGDTVRDLVIAITVLSSQRDEPVARKAAQLRELGPGTRWVWDRPPLEFDARALVVLDEAAEGSIVVTASLGETVVASTTRPIRLLAYNQWCCIEGAFELLAAHVQPNHPIIEEVRQRGSEILQADTGSSSQEGYQAGKERALHIARGIYLALRERRIRYSDPPASFETSQKVRTPDQILGDRFGTCLDTACLLGACLEQAGLSPVLFVVRGHAFTGMWVSDNQCLPDASITQPQLIQNCVDAQWLIPIETTFFTEAHDKSFAEAITAGLQRLATIPFVAAVDVRVSRAKNVRPLPSRTMQDGNVIVLQHVAPAPAGTTIVAGQRRFVSARRTNRSPAPPRMQRWKEDLLDLSLRNPLLQLKLGRGGGLLIVTPPNSLRAIEELLAAGEALSLVAHDQITELQRQRGVRVAHEMSGDELHQVFAQMRALFVGVDESRLRSSIRRLTTQARTLEEELGSNVLHLTLGTLVWTDPEKEKKVRSPLIVLPVRLHVQARGKPPQLTADLSTGGTVLNQCLLQKLRASFGLEVPELSSWRGDVDGADLDVPLAAMRAAIAVNKLEMSIEEEACLCLLHFGKFRMWKDLEDHWETLLQQPVVRHLVQAAGTTFANAVSLPTREDLEAASIHCPIPCDGSQLQAIVAATRGCSFVLEGPPGTGKSQTITNLVANALAEGKRILFVAEKRAALEVVKLRLQRVGLGAFCLDIHGRTTTPQQLRDQLLRSLEAPLGVDRSPWETNRKELAQVSDHLRRYTDSLHTPNSLGLSLWQAVQEVLVHGDGPRFTVARSLLVAGAAAVGTLRHALQSLPELAATARLRPHHPWSLTSTPDFGKIDAPKLLSSLGDVATAYQEPESLPASARTLLSQVATAEQLESLHAVLEATEGGCTTPLESLQKPPPAEVLRQVLAHAADIEGLLRRRATLLQTFAPSLFAADLDDLLLRAHKARRAFFLWRKGRMRVVHEGVQPHLRADRPTFDGLVAALAEAVAVRDGGRKHESEVRALSLPGLPADWSWSADKACSTLQLLVRALEHGPGVAQNGLGAALRAAVKEAHAVHGLLTVTAARLAAWRNLREACAADDGAIAKWLGNRPIEAAIVASLPEWQRDAVRSRFLELDRWCQLQSCLHVVRAHGMTELADAVQSGRLRAEEALRAFDRSVAHESLEERLTALQFERFDGKTHTNRIRTFQRLRDADGDALKAVIPDKLVDSRPFRPGQRMGQVAELDRKELQRQKGGLSIRALLETYSEAVVTLMPCVLASPDSVAQFLAPGVIDFDLVVFDEASQVPVADAVGAIGRGKALVVVGDSRQMPPTAFFGRTNTADVGPDEESTEVDDVPPDMESVLSEAVASGLPRIWLSWHYRSQDESLITFSNRFYYDNRLASFPAPAVGARGKGVHFLRVQGGVFDSGRTRTNEKEAKEVVDEIRRRLRDPADRQRSIGVVALNLQQAELLREKLEEAAAEDPALDAALRDESENHLFVKNLENVQGDERDVIVISLTYAPNRQGQFPMNFGPLNRIGGERRWNVLVTRARQEVVLVASIEPEDIKLERVSPLAKGVAHMRAYLAMARDGIEKSHDVQLGPVVPPDLHRDRIAGRIRELGFHVEVSVGLSTFRVDLSVADRKDPTRRLVAILLDGPAYAARATVQDRDGLPGAVLHELMGWPKVLRIWLPEWLNEQDRVLEDIREAVRTARQSLTAHLPSDAPPPTVASPAPQTPPLVPLERPKAPAPAAPSALPREATTPPVPTRTPPPPEPIVARNSKLVARDPEDLDYRPYLGGNLLGTKDDIDARASGVALARIRQAIQDVLAVEAPIEGKRLARLVARRFGLMKAREDRIKVILAIVPEHLLRRTPFGDFVWPPGVVPEDWRSFRRQPENVDPRPFEEIPPEEVCNALIYSATRGLGLSPDGAIEELAMIFRIGRVSQQIRNRMDAIIQWSISTGHLARDSRGRITAAN